MVGALLELLMLFSTAAFMGLGLYKLALPMLAVMLWRGWRMAAGDAQKDGWPATVLALAIPASAILCFRALRNGHWF